MAQASRSSRWTDALLDRMRELDSARYQLVSRLARPFGRDLLRALFMLERGGDRAAFAIPDHLARSWELSA